MTKHDLDQLYQSLMAFEISKTTSVSDALKKIEMLIDLSGDLGRSEGVERGIELAQLSFKQSPTDDEAALLHYFISNAWALKRDFVHRESSSEWDWEQPEIEKELLHLRQAISSEGFRSLPEVRKCQISTNYGNLLSHVGRFVEAIEYWNRALILVPKFSMALANRGLGLIGYAQALYDSGHQHVFLRQAHKDLNTSLDNGVDPHAIEVFKQHKLIIEGVLSTECLTDGIDMDDFSLGDSEEERKYRRWCLDNQLFLNPLNDLKPFPIAAHDCFTVPSIVVDIGEGPTYHGFFNQLKQEFVSARFLYYEGITAEEPHFADKDVLLYNTLDYPVYSLAIEKVKIAFRMSYSLFDKIAFFLNDYLKLGIPERQISFRTIWYEKQQRKKGLKQQFKRYKNLPLRGLFWLSKDLFEDEPGFREAIEPDAQELNDLRNYTEHKYLKVHDMWSSELAASSQEAGLSDRLACSIKRHDFEAKALRMLKLARAALIYLSLGVHSEEQNRQSHQDGDKFSMPSFWDTWEDDWKV